MRSRGRLLALVAAAVVLVAGLTTWSVLAGGSSGSNATSSGARPGCRVSVTTPPAVPTVGQVAPAFQLPGLSGGCVRLDALRGRPMVLNFWASYCHPCRQEFPLLGAAFRTDRSRGLAVVGVTWRDIPDDARQFARDHHGDWTLALDDGDEVGRAYAVAAVPQTLFVRRDGTISARIYGPLSSEDLTRELSRILAA